MTTITVALFRGHKLVSKLIQWQTRSEYSHAAVVLPSGEVIESREGKGVQILKELDYSKEEIELYDVEVSDTQAVEIEAFLRDQIGKKYDWTMVARFITRRQESRSSSQRWFCSELVFAAFQQAGVNLLRAVEPWKVSPGLLAMSTLLKPRNDED